MIAPRRDSLLQVAATVCNESAPIWKRESLHNNTKNVEADDWVSTARTKTHPPIIKRDSIVVTHESHIQTSF